MPSQSGVRPVEVSRTVTVSAPNLRVNSPNLGKNITPNTNATKIMTMIMPDLPSMFPITWVVPRDAAHQPDKAGVSERAQRVVFHWLEGYYVSLEIKDSRDLEVVTDDPKGIGRNWASQTEAMMWGMFGESTV